MSFECAVTHDGVRCAATDHGDTTYLGVLTFCTAHQEAFENIVSDSSILSMEVASARVMRVDWCRDLVEGLRNRPPIERVEHAPTDLVEARRNAPVYFLRCEGFIKIGFANDPLKRLQQIRSMDGTKFPEGMNVRTAVLVNTEDGGFPREQQLHHRFARLRHTGEWFIESHELSAYIDALSDPTPDAALRNIEKEETK